MSYMNHETVLYPLSVFVSELHVCVCVNVCVLAPKGPEILTQELRDTFILHTIMCVCDGSVISGW